ncbi:MAG: polysaccharide biosynthesis C-terminal domain-containing protein [Synergistaceae bacterium]|nr:polysaccharide biosynthesis C-terminal domain-containing protein [Synergistaceae bacterium]
MAKSIKRNYVYNLAYQILTLITPFITTPYVTRVLSPNAIGLSSFAFSLSQTFGLLASVGILIYGQREISYAQDDRQKRTQIFWELQMLSFVTSIVWIALYMFVVVFYIKHDYVLFLVFILQIIPFNSTFLFYAMEEFGKIMALSFIFKILDISIIFIFIKSDADLPLYVLGSMSTMVLPNLLMWLDVHKYVDWPDLKLLKSLKPFRNIMLIISLFLPTISSQIYSVLDKIMLGFIAQGAAENGYYELALRISKMPLMVVASLGIVIVPRIGHLYKANEVETLQAYIYRSFKFAWFASVPLCFGLIAVSNNFVAWFFGGGYRKVSDLLKISSSLLIIIGLSSVNGQYFVPTGQQNKYTITLVTGAVVNFSLNMFLIPRFYSYGALTASVLAELAVLASQLYFLRKEFSIRKIISDGFSYLAAGFIMFAALRSFSYKLPLNPLGTAIMIFSGALIYFGVLLILRDEFFISYSMRTINFLKRRIKMLI